MYYVTVITVAVGKTALFGSPSLMWLVIIHFRQPRPLVSTPTTLVSEHFIALPCYPSSCNGQNAFMNLALIKAIQTDAYTNKL